MRAGLLATPPGRSRPCESGGKESPGKGLTPIPYLNFCGNSREQDLDLQQHPAHLQGCEMSNRSPKEAASGLLSGCVSLKVGSVSGSWSLLVDERRPPSLQVCLVQLELELEHTGLRDPLMTIVTHAQTSGKGLPCVKGRIQHLVQVHTLPSFRPCPSFSTLITPYSSPPHPQNGKSCLDLGQ